MTERKKYVKRVSSPVVAVKLDLATEGFSYEKWGGVQNCKSGDWVLDNDGDIYTVDGAIFEATYEAVGQGLYVKTTPVWVELAQQDGQIKTAEGVTRYQTGDYLVARDTEGEVGYAVPASSFEAMYQLVP